VKRPMSNADRIAATIRAELKGEGWTSRDVSVRVERYSMGATVHVVVRRLWRVDVVKVRAIAERLESVRRDASGEILGGGNVYVDVRVELEGAS